jgi:plasmid stabilization system protein ParE
LQVYFTPSARTQFLSALSYIHKDKPGAAADFEQRVEIALRRLEDFPESGSLVREFPDSPFQQVVIKPYRFFYRIEKRVLWIVGVWHSSQLPDSPDQGNR